MGSSSNKNETVVVENARAVSNRDLPPIESKNENRGSILLFYQYVEPIWTDAEHKQALKKVIELGKQHDITGRGRVAPEGLNCTLTGMPERIRSFCYELRKWNSLFNETDFKITDGVDRAKLFKSLSIRKAEELVAYGLSGGKYCIFFSNFQQEMILMFYVIEKIMCNLDPLVPKCSIAALSDYETEASMPDL